MPSFDIVSEVSHHELTNAVDQTAREIDNRFDFKGTSSKIEHKDSEVVLYGDNDFQLEQIKTILLTKAAKRDIDAMSFDFHDPETHQSNAKMRVTIKEGISKEFGKKLIQMIKSEKLKVQASIQEAQVRVTGKKRDDLQQVIAFLKESNLDQPLQYQNFRD
tara:strand:+ start:3444 stop:3926 length:483 start_codon:yes stop_codon:yes gene_type:complete